MDDDEPQRSRAIPARTTIGKRSAIFEKFPYLSQPLHLFGGLITIPNYGYRTTPIAIMDLMMADLPHICYNYNETYSEQEEQNRLIIMQDMRDKIKQHGLRGIDNLNLNFNQNVQDGNQLLQQLKQQK